MSVQLGFTAEEIILKGRVTNDEITQINIWLESQKNLPVISEEEIVNFLLSNDNDQKGTKNTITAFFKIRNEAPEIFNNRLMSQENSDAIQSVVYFGVSPKRTEDNCAVIFTQFYETQYQNFDHSQYVKFLFMALDAAIFSSPPSGFIVVVDLFGFGLMHLTKMRLSAIRVFFRYLQEALPVKLKNILILNTPSVIDKVLTLIKPFMSDNIKKLLIYHKRDCNMDEFYEKYVPKELMPEDYGGELPCMKDLAKQLIENLKDMEPYFTAEENRRSIMN